MIIPLSHEHTTVRRLPWVTFTVIGLCFLAFIATRYGGGDIEERLSGHFEKAFEYYFEHPYLELDEGVWRLTRPRMVRLGGGYAEGAFAWCQKNLAGLPSIEDYRAIPQEAFATQENYHIAATLGYFLLEGGEGRYRKPFIDLLAEVHRVHDAAKSFDRCFPKVSRDQLQSEWEQFVRGIELGKK